MARLTFCASKASSVSSHEDLASSHLCAGEVSCAFPHNYSATLHEDARVAFSASRDHYQARSHEDASAHSSIPAQVDHPLCRISRANGISQQAIVYDQAIWSKDWAQDGCGFSRASVMDMNFLYPVRSHSTSITFPMGRSILPET